MSVLRYIRKTQSKRLSFWDSVANQARLDYKMLSHDRRLLSRSFAGDRIHVETQVLPQVAVQAPFAR